MDAHTYVVYPRHLPNRGLMNSGPDAVRREFRVFDMARLQK